MNKIAAVESLTMFWPGWEASCLGRLAILISEFSVAQSPQR